MTSLGTKRQNRRTHWALWVVALGTAVLFFPFRYIDCPGWDVWTLNRAGKPLSGITVRLSCRNYSADFASHEKNAITDGNGHAAFRARYSRSSLAQRILVTARSAATGVHGSFGPHANVIAFGRGLQGVDVERNRNIVIEWTGKPAHMKSQIVLEPASPISPSPGPQTNAPSVAIFARERHC